MATASKTITVLGFPAFSNRNSNIYNYTFYTAVEKHGIEVDEFSFQRALFGHHDIIHVHWPEKFLNSHYRLKALLWSTLFLFCLKLHRLKGGRVVWTAHNLKPHEIKYPRLSKLFWENFLRTVNATISLSKTNQKIMLEATDLPNATCHTVIYHPLYKQITADNTEKNLQNMGISTKRPYCLFFGRILPYKNVEKLIAMFKDNPPEGINLVVAGNCENQAYKDEITALAESADRVTFISRRTGDEELHSLIQGCAVGILPFKTIFNSGSLLQFPSYGKPVMAPYSDNFAEYGSLFKTSPFILYRDTLTRETIEKAVTNLPDFQQKCPRELTEEETGIRAAEFFRKVVG